MAHTPGPWKAERRCTLSMPWWHINTATIHGEITVNTSAEDACLIAAAPELLAIAKWVRDNMEPLGKDPSDGVGGWRHMDATEVDSIVSGVLHFCDEAIAKAEGRADDQS